MRPVCRIRQIDRLIVTDVGGTKRDIVRPRRVRFRTTTTFVGGHPLGGGERGGFAFARPDLFAGRPWIFTPDGRRLGGRRRAAFAIRDRSRREAVDPVSRRARSRDGVCQSPSAAGRQRADGHGRQRGAGVKVCGWPVAVSSIRHGSPRVPRTSGATSVSPTPTRSATHSTASLPRLTQLRGDLRRGEAIEAIFSAAAKWRAELMKDNH